VCSETAWTNFVGSLFFVCVLNVEKMPSVLKSDMVRMYLPSIIGPLLHSLDVPTYSNFVDILLFLCLFATSNTIDS
jgi:hypothetical protein